VNGCVFCLHVYNNTQIKATSEYYRADQKFSAVNLSWLNAQYEEVYLLLTVFMVFISALLEKLVCIQSVVGTCGFV